MNHKVKIFVVIFSVACFAAFGAAKPKAPSKNIIHSPVTAEVTYIIDGDTFSASVLLDAGIQISVRVRIMQIDAPELKGECEKEIKAAFAAKDRLTELIPIGSRVILNQVKDDKYLGRIDAFVTDESGRDIGEIMVRENHAVRYGGGKRCGWCD